MFSALLETQRAAVTAVVFIATFLISFSIGRYLKRRAGVRLGVLFRLFCLTLAFYAAIAAYGLHTNWRNHVGAALVLLSSAFVVALINHYVWDVYFERRKQTPIPQFLREVMALVIFLIALLLVLWYGYHAGHWLTGLLATSGVAAIILGLAGQNLLRVCAQTTPFTSTFRTTRSSARPLSICIIRRNCTPCGFASASITTRRRIA